MNTEELREKLADVAWAAVPEMTRRGEAEEAYFKNPVHVKIIEKEDGKVELYVRYGSLQSPYGTDEFRERAPTGVDESDKRRLHVPEKIAAALLDAGIERSRMDVMTNAGAEYGTFEFNNARIRVTLDPAKDGDIMALLEKLEKTVEKKNPYLFEVEETMREAVAKLQSSGRVTNAQVDEWLQNLTGERLASQQLKR